MKLFILGIFFRYGGCGGLKRTDFCQFALWEVVVDFKELILDNFNFWEDMVGLKGLIADYWLIWLCKSQPIELHIFVSLCECVCRLLYRPVILAEYANSQPANAVRLHQNHLSVLASLSSVYIIAHHLVDTSEFICCQYISILPSLMDIE